MVARGGVGLEWQHLELARGGLLTEFFRGTAAEFPENICSLVREDNSRARGACSRSTRVNGVG